MRRDIAKIIAEEPMVLTRTGWTYHPPVLENAGNIRYGYPEYDAYTGISRRFRAAGVRVNLTNLPTGWIDEDAYHFQEVDRTLAALFDAVPDALYIPRLRLDPPLGWLAKYPEEVCLFEQAPRDLEVIAALVRDGRVNGTYTMRGKRQEVANKVNQHMDGLLLKKAVKMAVESDENKDEH